MAADTVTDAPPDLPLQSDRRSAELVALCNRFTAELFDWLDHTLPEEPPDHAVPLKKAVSSVAFALAERLLYPSYLRRPGLVPPELQGEC